jgi:hypothetical protein
MIIVEHAEDRCSLNGANVSPDVAAASLVESADIVGASA